MRVVRLAILAAGTATGLLVGAAWLIDARAADRVPQGVAVEGVAVGGLTAEQARARIVRESCRVMGGR